MGLSFQLSSVYYRPAPWMLPEHAIHHGIHHGADTDQLHDLDAQAFHQVTVDDDLADEAYSKASVLGLDDHLVGS